MPNPILHPNSRPARRLGTALAALALVALAGCSEKKPTVPTPKAMAPAGAVLAAGTNLASLAMPGNGLPQRHGG